MAPVDREPGQRDEVGSRRVRTWLSELTDALGETLESAHSLEDVDGMDQRISLIALAVDDMGRAATFCEALGWRRVDSPTALWCSI